MYRGGGGGRGEGYRIDKKEMCIYADVEDGDGEICGEGGGGEVRLNKMCISVGVKDGERCLKEGWG